MTKSGSVSLPGELEVDYSRGVIYFHTSDAKVARRYGSVTVLRICGLPQPIPDGGALGLTLLEDKAAAMRTWHLGCVR